MKDDESFRTFNYGAGDFSELDFKVMQEAMLSALAGSLGVPRSVLDGDTNYSSTLGAGPRRMRYLQPLSTMTLTTRIRDVFFTDPKGGSTPVATHRPDHRFTEE